MSFIEFAGLFGNGNGEKWQIQKDRKWKIKIDFFFWICCENSTKTTDENKIATTKNVHISSGNNRKLESRMKSMQKPKNSEFIRKLERNENQAQLLAQIGQFTCLNSK